MNYLKQIRLSVFIAALSASQLCAATSMFGTVPSLIKYSFQEQQNKVIPGSSTETATGWNCNSGIKAADQIGNLALVATFYQNGCYTDGRYNHNNFLVKQGTVKNTTGTKTFVAYDITEPAKKATQFLASTHVIYYKFPTAEPYSVYAFNGTSNEIRKVASIAASQINTTQFIKVASLNVSTIKGSVIYIFAPDSQRVSVFTSFAVGIEGARVASNAVLNINKLRYSLTGQLYDTRTGFNFGPNDWQSRYGQAQRFFLGFDATAKKNATVWQDQSSKAINLTWTSKISRKTIVLPNTRSELLAAATFDDAGNLYYLTIQSGNGKPNTARTVTLYKTNSAGSLLLSNNLDASNAAGGLNMVEFFPAANLKYANGFLGLMLERTMFQSSDGLNHQGGIAVVFNANTLAQLKNWGQTSGHSFGTFLTKNSANEFLAIDLGDNYPRGVNLHRFTQTTKNSKVVYAFKTEHGTSPTSPSGASYPKYDAISSTLKTYYKWSNDNNSYAELGSVIENADGYSVFFIGEPDVNKLALNNARVGAALNDARDIGVVKVSKNFTNSSTLSSIVLSQGITETGGFYTFNGTWSAQQNLGVVWLVNYLNKDVKNASRLKAVKLAENKVLLLWEAWTPSSYVNTYAIVVDSLGNKLSTALTLGSHIRLNPGDDPLVIGNNVYLVSGDKTESKLELIEVEIK